MMSSKNKNESIIEIEPYNEPKNNLKDVLDGVKREEDIINIDLKNKNKITGGTNQEVNNNTCNYTLFKNFNDINIYKNENLHPSNNSININSKSVGNIYQTISYDKIPTNKLKFYQKVIKNQKEEFLRPIWCKKLPGVLYLTIGKLNNYNPLEKSSKLSKENNSDFKNKTCTIGNYLIAELEIVNNFIDKNKPGHKITLNTQMVENKSNTNFGYYFKVPVENFNGDLRINVKIIKSWVDHSKLFNKNKSLFFEDDSNNVNVYKKDINLKKEDIVSDRSSNKVSDRSSTGLIGKGSIVLNKSIIRTFNNELVEIKTEIFDENIKFYQKLLFGRSYNSKSLSVYASYISNDEVITINAPRPENLFDLTRWLIVKSLAKTKVFSGYVDVRGDYNNLNSDINSNILELDDSLFISQTSQPNNVDKIDVNGINTYRTDANLTNVNSLGDVVTNIFNKVNKPRNKSKTEIVNGKDNIKNTVNNYSRSDYLWTKRYMRIFGYTIYIFSERTKTPISTINIVDSEPISNCLNKNIVGFNLHKYGILEIHCDKRNKVIELKEAIKFLFPRKKTN